MDDNSPERPNKGLILVLIKDLIDNLIGTHAERSMVLKTLKK